MISPVLWPSAALTVARTFGLRGSLLRSAYEARRRAGLFRPRPRIELGTDGGEPLAGLAADADALRAVSDAKLACGRANRVLAGQHEAYRWDWRLLPADSASWRTNQTTGYSYSAEDPWWRVSHLSAASGDIKDVWEPARFAWLYDLVRGYLVTRDPAYARAAADRINDWAEANPPFLGVHWSCGQETAIRATALLYAEANLRDAAGITDARWRVIRDVLAASGERIADAIGYAISQRNNHGISEATGLIALGARFQQVHPEADRWLRRGHALLERLIAEQFAADGWYVQHSFTYQRLALDQCVIAERVLRSIGRRLSPESVERLRASVRLLLAVVDEVTGFVPNYGANDGAMVHPITLAPYRDFRPVITAACAMFGEPLPADVSVDREVLAWLGPRDVRPAPARKDGVMSGTSGWATARVGGTAVFLRAGRYQSRPSHIDPLQLDIRVGGREVIVDPGSYSYNSAPGWRNALASARVHNTPLLDGCEPGVRGPRFLWLVWPGSELRLTTFENGEVTIAACIPGTIHRVVRITNFSVDISDEVLAPGRHDLRITWLLHPDASPEQIACSGQRRVLTAQQHRPDAWFSPRYGERISSSAVLLETTLEQHSVVRTHIEGSRHAVSASSRPALHPTGITVDP